MSGETPSLVFQNSLALRAGRVSAERGVGRGVCAGQ